MPTECSPELFEFPRVEGRSVLASFDGGAITSVSHRAEVVRCLAHEAVFLADGMLQRLSIRLRIPTQAGRVFRREDGRGSDVKPVSIPT